MNRDFSYSSQKGVRRLLGHYCTYSIVPLSTFLLTVHPVRRLPQHVHCFRPVDAPPKAYASHSSSLATHLLTLCPSHAQLPTRDP